MPATVDSKMYSGRRILTVDPARFDAEMARHNADTPDKVATLLQIDRRTAARIRNGVTLPSNAFFAACVDAGVDHLSFLRVEKRGPGLERAA